VVWPEITSREAGCRGAQKRSDEHPAAYLLAPTAAKYRSIPRVGAAGALAARSASPDALADAKSRS